MSYKGIGLFTSSPLSAPPSSARKPVASTSRVLLEDSEEEEEHENTVTGGNSTNADDEDAEAEDSSGLAEGEFHVEAILARRGGYNGKRLMYKIRWLGFGPEADTWEPRENISASDLIKEFERQHLVPQKSKRSKDKKTNTPSTVQSKKSHTKPATTQIRSIALSRTPARKSRDKSKKPLFWQEPLPYIADELIVPISALVADEAWPRIRSYISKTRNNPKGMRKMVAFHPATLVRLRTQTPSTKLNTYFRAAAKETAQMIKENEFVMFGNGAFPQRSPFYESALDHVIIGGEAFQLSWPYGIEEPDQEVAHVLAALQHMSARLGENVRCRLLVRKVESVLREACDYFNVEVIDAKSFMKGL